MRKYLVAVALGAMLVAGEAAASGSDAINGGGQGGGSAAASPYIGVWVGLSAALLVGLLAWGLDRGGGHGRPVSP